MTLSTTRADTPMKPRSDGAKSWPHLCQSNRRQPIRRIRIISALSALALGIGTALAAERPAALIIAQGGLGDQSYNDLAYSGFKKALAENKLEGKAVESKDVVAQAADILRRA